jgi:error-prone DNA polymerase
MSGYAEIAAATNYSFLRGASHPHEMVVQAGILGMEAIGIADRNTLAGVVRALDGMDHPDMPAKRPKLLIGARLVFADGKPDILAYPRDRKAYGNLCRLLTTGKLRAKKGDCFLYRDDLFQWQEGLLLVVLPWEEREKIENPKKKNSAQDQPIQLLKDLRAAAPARVWLAATMPRKGSDKQRLTALAHLANGARLPLLATNDALYHIPERRKLQDVVTCIREHVTLDTAGRLLESNAERHLKSPEEMARLFREYPEAIRETLHFASRINFSLDDLRYNYPHEPVPPGKTANEHLRDLAWEGAERRYPEGIPDKVREIIEKELAMIAKLNIAEYFLTVHDIVGFANKRKILCQGRGSAANSAVCYALGITGVDPAKFDVLFERFISEERKEPPDIDVDFEHERREEVIQDIYKRYGQDRAALAATVICYRPRSAIREVGKVFGLTADVTASMASSVWGSWGSALREREIRQGNLDPVNDLITRAVDCANELIGFPRHLSQHVGGFVLTDDRLDTCVPIGPAAMEDRTFIEWDKNDIDRVGMMKVDVLALGMLTCIRKAFDLIAQHGGERYDLATVPREDPKVYDMLCKADAIGVFQVESRAQMNMLPRLAPREFYDLVVEIAIVRPGPIQGNMVHPYLKRRSGKEKVEYPAPHPGHGPADELFGVLGKTMGVPLFQEQAMKLAIVAAKFTPSESNGLRRAMATFRNLGTIDKFKEKFITGMTRRGYRRDFAERCFQQIEGFGSYGFPESHAASFAHLAYISAWIKKYHPAAFAAALLNAQPMGFYAPAEIVRDAREHLVEVRAPDVNFSDWDNTLERRMEDGALALRLGLRQIDGFKEDCAREIENARGYGYPKFTDLIKRIEIPKRAALTLAEADALRSLKMDRREALWAARRLVDDGDLPLFVIRRTPEQAKENIAALPAMPLSEHVLADYQTLRLSLKAYPTQFLRPIFDAEGIQSCAEVQAAADKSSARCIGIVLVRQMPGAKGVVFVTLSDETGVTNVVIWPSVFAQFRKEVMGARLLRIEGKIQRSDEGVVHLVAENIIDRTYELNRLAEDDFRLSPGKLEDLAFQPQDSRARHPRNVRMLPKSRDFH